MYSCHFDQAASTPLWAVPCQPYPVRAEQSNSTKGTSKLLARWDPQDVAEGLQHYRVAGVEDAPAPNLEREIDGVEALLPEVACQSLVPGQLSLVGRLEIVGGVPWHRQLHEHNFGRKHGPVDDDEVRLKDKKRKSQNWIA